MPFAVARWEPCGSVVQSPGEGWESHWSRSLSLGPLECILRLRGIHSVYHRSQCCIHDLPGILSGVPSFLPESRATYRGFRNLLRACALTLIFCVELRSFRVPNRSQLRGRKPVHEQHPKTPSFGQSVFTEPSSTLSLSICHIHYRPRVFRRPTVSDK